jgi:hypothetical protein
VMGACERASPLALPIGGVARPQTPCKEGHLRLNASAHASVQIWRDLQLGLLTQYYDRVPVRLNTTEACAQSVRHTNASNQGSMGRKPSPGCRERPRSLPPA